MLEQQERACSRCGRHLVYCVISEARNPREICQFVAIMRDGPLAGLPAVTEHCPRCNTILSLNSTFAVKREKKK